MTDRLSFSRLSADFRCLTTAANATLPPRVASRLAERNHSYYYLKEFRKLFLILGSSNQAYSLSHQGNRPFIEHQIENTTMKFIKTFVAVAALSLFSAASFAQSVSATASTLDRAEAKIAAQAARARCIL